LFRDLPARQRDKCPAQTISQTAAEKKTRAGRDRESGKRVFLNIAFQRR
jgi:hypothetical protein